MRLLLNSIIAIALLFIGCTSEYGETVKLILKFDGTAKEFDRTYNLRKEITDSTSYNSLIKSINNSETSIFSCPYHKNSAWTIEIYKVDKKNNGQLLYNLNCTTENEIGLWDNMITKCYKNDFLIKHIIAMVKVEEIRNFKGKMTQKDYDKLFEAESSK